MGSLTKGGLPPTDFVLCVRTGLARPHGVGVAVDGLVAGSDGVC